MKRNLTIALSVLVVFVSFCVFVTSPVVAKQKSVSGTANQNSLIRTDQTPGNKRDCIAVSEALYGKAQRLSRRTKQIIPREFERVAVDLDEFCGEENFEKARISIDWMNTCLNNFTKDYKSGFCSRNKNYFCGVYPQSEACLQSQ
jgi:gamma-glutamylcysteine synthetase